MVECLEFSVCKSGMKIVDPFESIMVSIFMKWISTLRLYL